MWNDIPLNNTQIGQEVFFSLKHVGLVCEVDSESTDGIL
jgi:hypothetical protein